jgi:predicted CoA-binding protein
MRGPEQILKETRTIAVVGLSDNPDRTSYRVAKYLQGQGYHIVPVNPTIDEVLGEKSYPDLASVPEPVDLVHVFRRSEEVMPVAEQAVAMEAAALWMQDGIVNEEAAELARINGLNVVMDDCVYRWHRRLKSEGKL